MHALDTVWAEESALGEARAWQLLRALAGASSAGRPIAAPCGVLVDPDGELRQVPLGRGSVDLFPDQAPAFRATSRISAEAERLLDLYLPLCLGAASAQLVVAHVAQSLDGQIATASGSSRFITGEQDLVHTHRLRALFDAVLVGRATIACDDPRLTTRLVPGPNPARVVVDPGLRAPLDRHVFRDRVAATIVLCSRGAGAVRAMAPSVRVVEIPHDEQVIPPELLLAHLGQLGLRRIFVEGGGVTVSNFLRAGQLDRLHLAISPIFLGQGRPAVVLPGIDGLDGALRPEVRRFALGEDVLFDCRLGRRETR